MLPHVAGDLLHVGVSFCAGGWSELKDPLIAVSMKADPPSPHAMCPQKGKLAEPDRRGISQGHRTKAFCWMVSAMLGMSEEGDSG